jgi:hypothetical protein
VSILTTIGKFILEWLLNKGVTLAVEYVKKEIANKKIDKEVNEQVEAHEEIVKKIKEKKGKMSDEDRKRLRETSRSLINGVFK